MGKLWASKMVACALGAFFANSTDRLLVRCRDESTPVEQVGAQNRR